MQAKKYIIVAGPSGAGKSSIVLYLLENFPQLELSVSAASRQPRATEKQGREYHFMSASDFRQKLSAGEFVEWEEVYPDHFYGTLKSELERIFHSGKQPLFDIDVVGGLSLKKLFKEGALSLFIAPPSLEELGQRLKGRRSETAQSLAMRLAKAEQEMGFVANYDRVIINHDLKFAGQEAKDLVSRFLVEGD